MIHLTNKTWGNIVGLVVIIQKREQMYILNEETDISYRQRFVGYFFQHILLSTEISSFDVILRYSMGHRHG